MTALALVCLAPHAAAQTPELDAPNIVRISGELVTSGQPTARALAQLASQGFEVVIYLAAPTVPDAVPGEAAMVERQGLQYESVAQVWTPRGPWKDLVANLLRENGIAFEPY